MVPNGLPPRTIDDVRKPAIEAAADSFAAIIDGQGYRLPFKPGEERLPVGIELVRAQQRDRDGAGLATSPATRSTSTRSPRG